DRNDILQGGPGDDYLVGGEGDDTYVWNHGSFSGSPDDGTDTIIDSDGKGRIRIDGQIVGLLLGNQQGWISPDGKISFQKQGADGAFSLGSGLIIKDFHDGDLGIQLEDALADPVFGDPPIIHSYTNSTEATGDWYGYPLWGTASSDHII